MTAAESLAGILAGAVMWLTGLLFGHACLFGQLLKLGGIDVAAAESLAGVHARTVVNLRIFLHVYSLRRGGCHPGRWVRGLLTFFIAASQKQTGGSSHQSGQSQAGIRSFGGGVMHEVFLENEVFDGDGGLPVGIMSDASLITQQPLSRTYSIHEKHFSANLAHHLYNVANRNRNTGVNHRYMSSASTVNIATHLPRMAQSQPDQVAIHCPIRRIPGGKTLYSQITYAQLEQYSNRIANGLLDCGVKRGDRVALMVPPSGGKDFFALVFALFKIGAVMVCVDPGIGTQNLGKCLAQARPSVFIGIPKAQAARLVLGWARQTLRIKITVGTWPGLTLKGILKRGSDKPVMADTTADEAAAILFTSGSTGIPKGVVYSHANFVAQVQALIDGFDIKPGEVDLCTFPLFALYAPAMGMTAVIPIMDFTRPGSVDPNNIIEPIRDFKVNNLFGSPALLKRVGEYGKFNEIKLHSLHRVISAGAPVPASTLRTFKTMLNPATQIFTPYGATESLPVAILGSDVILKETAPLTEQGKGVCVGKPVPTIDVRIVRILDGPIDEWSDDIIVDQHTVGEICVKGPQVTAEYFGMTHATSLAKIRDPEGGFWHRMGDLGYIDEQDRLWFCGRKSQRVHNKHGVFYTICCEGVFNTHPKVARTAVVDGDKDRTTLCVELIPGVLPSEHIPIRNQLLELGSLHPHTQSIKHVLFHPSFPVDIRHNAKINRELLSHWARGLLP